ncbi:MAG: CHASE domain-containing protein, partial [Pseudomonadota bacterium]
MVDKTEQTMDLRRESAASSVNRIRRWLVSYPRGIPLALFVTISAITALSVFAIESNARATEEAQVRGRAQFIASALEQRANNFSSYLRAGAALLSTTQEVERDLFRQFVSELRLDLDYRGSEGIGWAAVIGKDAVSEFAAQQRRLQPDFPAIRPPVSEDAAFAAPVAYFHPDTPDNRRALGFDMYSEPVRASAMGEAQRSGQPTASARITLARQGGEDAPGFVIFEPVSRPVPGGRSMDRALAGFIYSPFSAGEFLDAALEEESTGGAAYGVRLYDGIAETKHLLASHSLVGGGGARVEQPLMVANRRLLLVVEAPRGGSLDLLSMATLVFGMTLASLLMLLARLLTQQAFEDQARLAFFEEQHSIRNSLTRELNHRVKNTLANVLSILALTRRRASNLDEFAHSLDGRIRSLSATHDLLTGTDWGTTPLRS